MTAVDWEARRAAMHMQLHKASGAAQLALVDPAIDLALDCNNAGRADLSIHLLHPLCAQHAHIAKLWQVLGLAYRAEQDLAPACDAMAQAKALAPADALIAMGHAQCVQEAGLPSAHLFAPLAHAFPDHADLAMAYAAALLTEGQGKDALTCITDLVARRPRSQAAQDGLVQLRSVLGDDDAMRGYHEAIAQHPDDTELHIGLLRALTGAGQWDAAKTALAKARRQLGNGANWDAFSALIASETGDYVSAEQLFRTLQPMRDPGVMLQHVRHCLRTHRLYTGQLQLGETIATQMLDGPMAQAAWPYLGLFWRLRGDDRATWLDGDPPFVRIIDLDFAAGELAALADVVRGLHTARLPMPGQSVRGGTQTDQPLFHAVDPAIQALRRKVLAAVRDYVDALPVDTLADNPTTPVSHPLLSAPRTQLKFAGSWSVRLQGGAAGGGHHVAHTHTHGWISSALYIAVPDGMADDAARRGWLQLGAPPPELGLELPPYQFVQPKPGRLVLFPSTMWHGTQPFANGERLTVAFDMARQIF
jgi:Flp pilus assembly protein TadD